MGGIAVQDIRKDRGADPRAALLGPFGAHRVTKDGRQAHAACPHDRPAYERARGGKLDRALERVPFHHPVCFDDLWLLTRRKRSDHAGRFLPSAAGGGHDDGQDDRDAAENFHDGTLLDVCGCRRAPWGESVLDARGRTPRGEGEGRHCTMCSIDDRATRRTTPLRRRRMTAERERAPAGTPGESRRSFDRVRK